MNTNRWISVLLAVAMALSLCVFVAADNPASLRLGDANGNGTIEAADALEILQYAVGKRSAFSAEQPAAPQPAGEPAVKQLPSLEAYETWVQGLKQAPADWEEMDHDTFQRTFFQYAQPRYQPMLAADRFYLLPVVPSGWRVAGVTVWSVDVGFELTDGKQTRWFGYSFAKYDETYFTNLQCTKQTIGDTTYWVMQNKDGTCDVFLPYGAYYIDTVLPADQLTAETVTAALACRRVDLPPWQA